MSGDRKINLKKHKVALFSVAAIFGALSLGLGVGAVNADNSSSSNSQSVVSANPTNSSSGASSIVTSNVSSLSGNAAEQASEIEKDPNYKYATNLTGNAEKAQNAVIKDGVESVSKEQSENKSNAQAVTKNDSATVASMVTQTSDQVQQMRVALRNNGFDDTTLTDDQVRVLVAAYQHKYGLSSKTTMSTWVADEGTANLNKILQAALSVAPAKK